MRQNEPSRDKIFISYRRLQTARQANRLALDLSHILPNDCVFLDKSSIELGTEFPKELADGLLRTQIVAVLIAPGWASLPDVDGKPRLCHPNDYVRMEVEYALKYGKLVVPILYDGACMPKRTEVPPDLESLCALHAFEVSSESPEEAASKIVLSCNLGVIPKSKLLKILEDHSHVVEWEPNLRWKSTAVGHYCKFGLYETLLGIIDLTSWGNANHFIAITNAGLHHRSIQSDGVVSFLAYAKIHRLLLDSRRSTLILNEVAWNIAGSFEDHVYNLINDLCSCFRNG